jgi:hypothetical protein
MGADELPKPPHWAEALLRTGLSPEEAEIQALNLIATYRDSVYPRRGRWIANFWFVREVVGCTLRARGMGVRNWILAGLALSGLVITVSLLMYPTLAFSEGGWLPIVAAGLIFYGYIAIRYSRAATANDAVVLRLGTRYGIAMGTSWIVGVVGLNLGVGIGAMLIILAYALPVVAGAHGAAKLWRVGASMRIGFWSGLVSGLVVFLLLMAFGYILAFVPGIPGAEIPRNHTYTAVEYQEINVSDTLGGGLFQLFGGAAFSVVGATVGGIAGILLTRTGRGDEVSHQVNR